MKHMNLILGTLIFSVLPIWRLAGTKSDAGEGMTLWEYFYWATRPEYIYRFERWEILAERAHNAYEKTKILPST